MMLPFPIPPRGPRGSIRWQDVLLAVAPVVLGEVLAALRDRWHRNRHGHGLCGKCGEDCADVVCKDCEGDTRSTVTIPFDLHAFPKPKGSDEDDE